MLYNIDRWIAYTKQANHRDGNFTSYPIDNLVKLSRPQLRRMRKKMRKRFDTSIGVY